MYMYATVVESALLSALLESALLSALLVRTRVRTRCENACQWAQLYPLMAATAVCRGPVGKASTL